MKVFISGGSGSLGRAIARKLQKEDRIVIYSRTEGKQQEMYQELPEGGVKGLRYFLGDVADLERLKMAMKGCDIVIHAACTACEGLSVFSPNFIYQNTAQITASVISAAIQNKVTRFVYLSSMARYGSQQAPFTEDMPCKPEDPYGIGKYSSELLLKNLSKVHGMDYSIAIPHNIIGSRQKYDDPYRNVVAIFINRMLQGKQPIIYGDGNQIRCFSFINDDIYCLERLVFANNVIGEEINIGPDSEFVTINELAEEIASQLNFKLNPIYVADRPSEVKLAYCSADKARNLLDYKVETSLHDGIKSMIDYIQLKGVKEFQYHLPIEIEKNCPITWINKLI